MEQPISRKQHGIADYGYIPLVAAAPSLVGFENEPTATRLARIISGGVLASSLLTRYEWGVWKVIPFNAHLAADAAVSAFSLASPWLLGFSKNKRARNTFLAIGLFGTVVGLLTRPDGQ
ncbi:SPW repeat domain-containing protein [Spirosoma aerophilum]